MVTPRTSKKSVVRKAPKGTVSPAVSAVTNGAAKLAKQPPTIEEKKKRKQVTTDDLLTVSETSMLVAIDLQRQPDASLEGVTIEEDQKLFPYTILPRLLVGWQPIGFISSFEMKLEVGKSLPQIVVRFAEKMSQEDVAALDAGLRAQIEAGIAILRQYPFVRVESPLLTAPVAR
jgi:hypothetical protein